MDKAKPPASINMDDLLQRPPPPPSILHAFLRTCQQTPDKPGLLFAGRSYSYGQLYHAAADWATRLRDDMGGVEELGLLPGDRVGLFLGNSADFLAAYLGVYLAGGIVVLINTQYRQSELHHILNDAGMRICITDAAHLPELERVRPTTPELETILLAAEDGHPLLPDAATQATLANRGAAVPIHLPQPADLALLAYTSGTTGRAKGAMLTHGNLAANSAAIVAAWHWSAADVLLLTLPLFHIHGLGVGVHGTFLAGGSIDLRPRFAADEVYTALYGGQVSMFFGVPTMYTRLLAAASTHDPAGQRPPPALRLCVSGSAPLSPQTFAAFEQRFGQRILERYGMTETGMNLTNPYEGERRPGTVGLPFPGQEARIVDVTSRTPLSPQVSGEIQVRGPHVCSGYWQRPDATAAAFTDDGWFHTGDLGWCSSDGYFTIAGRARELIISGGYNVYPREVEEMLLSHPAIAEAAVVGLPDPDLGEQVVAVVVPQQPAEQMSQTDRAALVDALIALCREQLAAYKKPRQFHIAAALPRNALGKIQKHVLKEQL